MTSTTYVSAVMVSIVKTHDYQHFHFQKRKLKFNGSNLPRATVAVLEWEPSAANSTSLKHEHSAPRDRRNPRTWVSPVHTGAKAPDLYRTFVTEETGQRITYAFKQSGYEESSSSLAEGKTGAIVVLGVSEIRDGTTTEQIKCLSIYVLDNKGLGPRKQRRGQR